MPGRFVQVLRGRGERELRPDRALRLGQGPQQPVVERRVRDHVGDGRAGRQHPVFHPQVRHAVRHRIHRPVPAVNGPVVQAHLGQLGTAAAVQGDHGVLLLAHGQQRREVPDVLLEQVEHRGDPPLAEPHPGPDPLMLQLVGPGVGGLLEQGDPGFVPQPTAEQVRGVRGHRDLDARDGLGRVPVVRELFRADLDVQLDARAGRFGGDAAGVREQPFRPVDRDPHVLTSRREDLLVQYPVPRVGRDRALVHVLFAQRGQDADRYEPAARAAGLLVGTVEAVPDLLFQVRYRVAGELAGRDVDLQVELAQLGRPGRVGDGVEHVRVAHGRLPPPVHQVQLDLHADLGGITSETVLTQHAGEHVERAPHLVAVLPAVLAGDLYRLNVAAHKASTHLTGETRECSARLFSSLARRSHRR